ncbi:hypothetical protein [Sphaerisporangium rhizosphaerae]|uniref:Uncharacterized protein n=1 Tax=Sphaerisporangium rhizosphaerae TaxID=2269375 RepID=A0ABW2P8F6_9ACTN
MTWIDSFMPADGRQCSPGFLKVSIRCRKIATASPLRMTRSNCSRAAHGGFPWMRRDESFGYPPKYTEAQAAEPVTSAALLGADQVRRAEISIRDL